MHILMICGKAIVIESYDLQIFNPSRLASVRRAFEISSWILGWLQFAACTAIVWNFAATSSLAFKSCLARGIVVAAALALLIPVTFLLDLFGGRAQRAWDKYEWDAAK